MTWKTRWKFTVVVYKWWKMLICADESDRMRASRLIAQHLQEIKHRADE